MIYAIGFIGFIGGFLVGQMILYFLLHNVSQEDLISDPYLKWKYGTLNWLIACAGSYAMVTMHNLYFL